jgi:hypothetical protein
VEETRKQAEVFVVDAGGAASGTTLYDRLTFAAILRGEAALGLVAHNIGASEAALGGKELRRLAKEHSAPFVSANVRDEQGLIAPPFRTVKAKDGRRITFIGVVSPSLVESHAHAHAQAHAQAHGVHASAPHEAVLATLETITPRPDYVVVLAYLPENELEAFSALVPEVDLVIGGPTGQSLPPRSLGPTTVMAVTNKGKFVGRVCLPTGNEKPAIDIVELGEAYGDDERQLENVQSFRDELGRLDIVAADTRFASAGLGGSVGAGFAVAGTDACRTCHTADAAIWDASAHAHAWETLVASGSHVDPSCQHCHTTGFGRQGGFESVRRSILLTNVGCESCHGPSAAHTADPKTMTGFGASAKDQCTTCHDHENSPHFELEGYWSQVVHGREPAAASGPARNPGSSRP